MKKIGFQNIEDEVQDKPGIYEIHTNTGCRLKVGISVKLRERLLRHRASRDSGLKLKPGGMRSNPEDVVSKGSVLAKHLYYDQSITSEYDLATEVGRRAFLVEKCHILYAVMASKDQARECERIREGNGTFRYVGRVRVIVK